LTLEEQLTEELLDAEITHDFLTER
jgi:hypothetical protein